MRGSRRLWLAALAAASVVAALAAGGTAGAAGTRTAAVPDFGPNVTVFDPSMSVSTIEAQMNAVAAQQVPNQFGTQRYAFLFMPGTYGSPTDTLNTQVGYYTQVAGLGRSPGDVDVNGTFDVYNQCDSSGSCTALVNFWRSLSNLRLDAAGRTGCQTGEFWAVSQAAPLRRVDVHGPITLMDYCSAPSYASGGFIADSAFSNTIVNGSQQQWLTRNSQLSGWSNGVWNQVFSGVVGAPPQSFPNPPYTTLDATPVSRESPYLYVDARGGWNVFVPGAQTSSSGTTWQSGPTPGRSIPLSRFYIAKPGDSVLKIDAALALGKNLIFTPGVYDISAPIVVARPDTIVMGLGEATLTADNGTIPLVVGDVPGVEVSGLIIDAGASNSPALLQVGTPLSRILPPLLTSNPSDPTLVSDVYFRIGGPHPGKATKALVVDSNNVILDDIWAWRADHGDGVGWTQNTSDTGVDVEGNSVEATGLFSEHFQKFDVTWSGQDGKTIFFQNEMPYDPPNQAAWQHDGVNGYAAYKVMPNVRTHEAWGLGSYCFFNVNPSIHAFDAFEVPNAPGVSLHDILDLCISNQGTIDHVVNGTGPATQPNTVPNDVVSYP
jgi:hypothetical protein